MAVVLVAMVEIVIAIMMMNGDDDGERPTGTYHAAPASPITATTG